MRVRWSLPCLVTILTVASPSVGTAQALPADSLQQARRYSEWFLAGQIDSVFAHVHPRAQQNLSKETLSARLTMIRDGAGAIGAVLEERFVWRGGARQYWRTMQSTDAGESLVLRWVLAPTGHIMGIGVNLLSASPPIDSGGPPILGTNTAGRAFVRDGAGGARAMAAAPAAAAPATISLEQFRGLGWIIGRWRGVGQGRLASVGAFYEEYALINDSTVHMRTYADSSFARVTDSTRFELRGGVLGAVPMRGTTARLTRLAGDTAQWTNGVRYIRISADRWQALFPPRQGEPQPYYLLDRVGTATPATARDAVQRAALDYVEGFYEGDSTKHLRSIHPSVYKYGFGRSGMGYGAGEQMTWPQILDFSRNVRVSGRLYPASAVKEVRILDLADQTASVRVTAAWGIDYLLMGRIDGRWMITHVLWQSTPR